MSFIVKQACSTPFDDLRAKVEDLGETLYTIGSWMDPWLNIVPKETYPEGAGYGRSVFTIERSEADVDEEPWNYIAPISGGNPNGALDASTDFQSVNVGHKENTYKPERFPLVGPLVGQDDLVMYWHSKDFWMKYFKAMEMRSIRSVSNRVANWYMRFVPKMACNSAMNWGQPNLNVYGPNSTNPTGPDLSALGAANTPTSQLTQEMLDSGASALIQEGAYDPNTQGWLTLGPDGPIFPLLIGLETSRDILLNNSEFRSDLNQSFQGWGDTNPVIQRMGASRVIKNFRHIITPFPPRWALTKNGDTVNVAKDSAGNVLISVAVTIAGALATLAWTNNVSSATWTTYQVAYGGNTYVRIPVWANSNNSNDVTKGLAAIINPSWVDPTIATYEAAISLHPWVCTEEVLKPINAAPGMKWHPQNYFGEWDFITGNDALLGFASCAGVADPTHKLGRHFAFYRHAVRPIFPQFGRMWLFVRCSSSADTITCS